MEARRGVSGKWKSGCFCLNHSKSNVYIEASRALSSWLRISSSFYPTGLFRPDSDCRSSTKKWSPASKGL